ncbi:MAG: mismatch-specific DNA-glycosylase [Gemmatimonadota bacterium]
MEPTRDRRPPGFTRQQLESFRDGSVPDLVAPGVKLLLVGINPGLWTAAAQAHFAHPGNRFYKALHLAGITDRVLDVRAGFDAASRAALLDRGVGITNLVNRATIRADELTAEELLKGGRRLQRTARKWQPAVVAVVGLTAYRTAFNRPRAQVGPQPDHVLGGAAVWAVPNPSGLNAHYGVAGLAALYRAAAEAAGITCERA